MRKKLHKINDIFSWVLLFATALMLVYTLFTVAQAKKTGEGAFLFGYRPVFVLTGSMEPYMLTNSICLTKEVDSMDDIAVGDVVTFHVEGQSGNDLNITHRIIEIKDGIINTKGDNNSVSDDLPLTIDNIEAKVVCVFNLSALIIDKWETTSGKVMVICFSLSVIFAYYCLKNMILYFIDKKFPSEDPAPENETVGTVDPDTTE